MQQFEIAPIHQHIQCAAHINQYKSIHLQGGFFVYCKIIFKTCFAFVSGLCPSGQWPRQLEQTQGKERSKREYRTAHVKEEGRIVTHSSVRDKFLKPLRDLEHLREYRAAGRLLLQILTILSSGRI